jgi:hypothetical protein
MYGYMQGFQNDQNNLQWLIGSVAELNHDLDIISWSSVSKKPIKTKADSCQIAQSNKIKISSNTYNLEHRSN